MVKRNPRGHFFALDFGTALSAAKELQRDMSPDAVIIGVTDRRANIWASQGLLDIPGSNPESLYRDQNMRVYAAGQDIALEEIDVIIIADRTDAQLDELLANVPEALRNKIIPLSAAANLPLKTDGNLLLDPAQIIFWEMQRDWQKPGMSNRDIARTMPDAINALRAVVGKNLTAQLCGAVVAVVGSIITIGALAQAMLGSPADADMLSAQTQAVTAGFWGLPVIIGACALIMMGIKGRSEVARIRWLIRKSGKKVLMSNLSQWIGWHGPYQMIAKILDKEGFKHRGNGVYTRFKKRSPDKIEPHTQGDISHHLYCNGLSLLFVVNQAISGFKIFDLLSNPWLWLAGAVIISMMLNDAFGSTAMNRKIQELRTKLLRVSQEIVAREVQADEQRIVKTGKSAATFAVWLEIKKLFEMAAILVINRYPVDMQNLASGEIRESRDERIVPSAMGQKVINELDRIALLSIVVDIVQAVELPYVKRPVAAVALELSAMNYQIFEVLRPYERYLGFGFFVSSASFEQGLTELETQNNFASIRLVRAGDFSANNANEILDKLEGININRCAQSLPAVSIEELLPLLESNLRSLALIIPGSDADSARLRINVIKGVLMFLDPCLYHGVNFNGDLDPALTLVKTEGLSGTQPLEALTEAIRDCEREIAEREAVDVPGLLVGSVYDNLYAVQTHHRGDFFAAEFILTGTTIGLYFTLAIVVVVGLVALFGLVKSLRASRNSESGNMASFKLLFLRLGKALSTVLKTIGAIIAILLAGIFVYYAIGIFIGAIETDLLPAIGALFKAIVSVIEEKTFIKILALACGTWLLFGSQILEICGTLSLPEPSPEKADIQARREKIEALISKYRTRLIGEQDGFKRRWINTDLIILEAALRLLNAGTLDGSIRELVAAQPSSCSLAAINLHCRRDVDNNDQPNNDIKYALDLLKGAKKVGKVEAAHAPITAVIDTHRNDFLLTTADIAQEAGVECAEVRAALRSPGIAPVWMTVAKRIKREFGLAGLARESGEAEKCGPLKGADPKHVARLLWKAIDLADAEGAMDEIYRQLAIAFMQYGNADNLVCLVLHQLCGFTTVEIGEYYGVSHTQISQRLDKTKELLRQTTDRYPDAFLVDGLHGEFKNYRGLLKAVLLMALDKTQTPSVYLKKRFYIEFQPGETKPQLAPIYCIIGLALGTWVGAGMLGWASAFLTSAIALSVGWLVHEYLGHERYKNYDEATHIRAGPIASLWLFLAAVAATIILFVFHNPIYSFTLIAAANFAVHTFADGQVLYRNLLKRKNKKSGSSILVESKLEIQAELFRGIYETLKTYSNVHRGTSLFSQVTTLLYDGARNIVLNYIERLPGYGRNVYYHVIFGDERSLWKIIDTCLQGKEGYFTIFTNELGLAFGAGALVVANDLMVGFGGLSYFTPPQPAGGTVRKLDSRGVVWADIPDRFEPGTPNIIGTIALAKMLSMIMEKNDENLFQGMVDESVEVEDFFVMPELSGSELLEWLKGQLIRWESTVPGLDIDYQPLKHTYIDFDNAASTPTFEPVWESAQMALRLSVDKFNQLIDRVKGIVGDFFGAPAQEYDVFFGRNTTDGISILKDSLSAQIKSQDSYVEKPIIIITQLEHNSNLLPWTRSEDFMHITLDVNKEGFINIETLKRMLVRDGDRIVLLAVSGASNVLGTVNDIKAITDLAHKYGVKVLVDAAQFAAHLPINMLDSGIDYLAFSGHKMYAPFGCGGLVARKGTIIGHEEPAHVNAAGLAGLGKSVLLLKKIGMDLIAREEKILVDYALAELKKAQQTLPQPYELLVYGPADAAKRIGVIAFQVKGDFEFTKSNTLIAGILAAVSGVGTRVGCFCAHILVQSILPQHSPKINSLTRISFGLYNTIQEIDAFIIALSQIGDFCAKAKEWPYVDHMLDEEYFKLFISKRWGCVYKTPAVLLGKKPQLAPIYCIIGLALGTLAGSGMLGWASALLVSAVALSVGWIVHEYLGHERYKNDEAAVYTRAGPIASLWLFLAAITVANILCALHNPVFIYALVAALNYLVHIFADDQVIYKNQAKYRHCEERFVRLLRLSSLRGAFCATKQSQRQARNRLRNLFNGIALGFALAMTRFLSAAKITFLPLKKTLSINLGGVDFVRFKALGSKCKVMIVEPIDEKVLELMRLDGRVSYDVIKPECEPMTQAQLLAVLADHKAMDYDTLFVFVKYQFNAQVFDLMPNLKQIVHFSTGYNNTDVAEAAARGIRVTFAPGPLTKAMAELTMGLTLEAEFRLASLTAFVEKEGEHFTSL
ncbi:MAG: aminotransferase class V-fold PLP-dependent enzyme, partial [Candidatus Omnitrophica bacterium]|nr:aminotransferase class V-fold PLP-dependent enzyme [Candidatus Omnitrophota bacterium]